MSIPDVVTREAWLAARTDLLAAEKAATKARDELNTRRRELPMVRSSRPGAVTARSCPGSAGTTSTETS
jgi:predicted dithiol-disulfide oxidoreductase (DUF899 family)